MATPGQRPDIEAKISLIADRLVRGKEARADRSIVLSRVRAAAAILGSSLTTLGVANPLFALASGKEDQKLSAVFGAFYGFPKWLSFIGVIMFVVTAIALAFYKQAKIDEKAIQSLALSDAFERQEIDLRGGLEQAEPIQQLNVVLNGVKTLESSNYKIMPKRDDYKTTTKDYVQEIIAQYCHHWGMTPPDVERREKIVATDSYFDQKVKGTVRAKLVLDEKDEPVALQGKERKHYKVQLYLETSNPDVQNVTYKLDPTYYDPVRESCDAKDQFAIELTTYGDYPVTVDAQVGSEIVRKVVPLSNLLGEAHQEGASAKVQEALSAIATN